MIRAARAGADRSIGWFVVLLRQRFSGDEGGALRTLVVPLGNRSEVYR